MNVTSKTAFITGAGSGIGRGIACSLARRGCNLALADINPSSLKETAASLRAPGLRVSEHLLDVRNRDAIHALPATIIAMHGAINILVNNAGIAAGGTFEQVSEEVFDRVIDVNFLAVVRITRAFLPYLHESGEARIVNISSVYGLISPAGQTAYAASKFAVRGFSNALRHELENGPVSVAVVHPGGIATNIALNAAWPHGTTDAEIRQQLALSSKLLRMPPEKAGEIIVEGIVHNKQRIIVGTDARLITLLERLMPVHYWKVLNRIAKLIEADRG